MLCCVRIRRGRVGHGHGRDDRRMSEFDGSVLKIQQMRQMTAVFVLEVVIRFVGSVPAVVVVLGGSITALIAI
jgi:hypothetical protein